MTVRLFDRRARVTVGGLAIAGGAKGELDQGLRVGFTIEKDTTKQPNKAEIVIYNLSASTRGRLSREPSTKVVVEAGYADADMLTLLFAGEMREAYSRPEPDGTWATILRAGDGDKHKRTSRKKTGLKPGVSFSRVVSETLSGLQVGLGNVWNAIKGGASLDDITKMGVNLAGPVDKQIEKLLGVVGMEHSVQDGQLQVVERGKVLGGSATLLSPMTGLEGSPEVDEKGVVTCRARIMPGLSPGYPVEIETAQLRREGVTLETGWYAFDATEEGRTVLYRIGKTRYVGDTHGTDWVAELTCYAVKKGDDVERKKKQAAAKATPEAAQ
jgi:hypothetical protein